MCSDKSFACTFELADYQLKFLSNDNLIQKNNLEFKVTKEYIMMIFSKYFTLVQYNCYQFISKMKLLIFIVALVSACSAEYLTKKQYQESTNFTKCDPSTDGDNIFKYSAVLLNNKTLSFSSLRGKVILVLNVATFCQSRIEYPALNQLADKFGSKLAIVAFPSNEFANVSIPIN